MLGSAHNDFVAVMVNKSSAEKVAWLIFLVVLLTTMACTSTTDTMTMSPTEDAPSQDSELTATPTSNLPVAFPQQEEADGEREAMTAEIFGTLVVVTNCIRINDNESDTSYLLIWPPNFTLSTKVNVIQILDEDGEVMACVGDEVRISGGEIKSLSFFSEPMQKQIPPNCSGPYWIVGDEVHRLERSD